METYTLLLVESLIIVLIHLTSAPELLIDLPLVADLQDLRHLIGQKCRLGVRDKRLIIVIYELDLLGTGLFCF